MNAQTKELTVDADPWRKPAVIPNAAVPTTPMEMIYHAVQQGQPIEIVRELMEMAREMKREQALDAFNDAVSKAKAEIPVIGKNATGHNNKRYADFSAYARVIDPILGKYGLSYRFRTTQTDKISVTCILSHGAGHFEENTLTGPADTTGSKNAIQAIGSTLTYLCRYTLMQALGLAAGEDDDGRATGHHDTPITVEQRDKLLSLISDVGADAEKLCVYFKIEAIADLPASQFNRAVAALEAKRQK